MRLAGKIRAYHRTHSMAHQYQILQESRREIDISAVRSERIDRDIELSKRASDNRTRGNGEVVQWMDTVCFVLTHVTSHGMESRTAS